MILPPLPIQLRGDVDAETAADATFHSENSLAVASGTKVTT